MCYTPHVHVHEFINGYYFKPGYNIQISYSSWGESSGRIYFAGVEASDIFHGYMDGGVRSAERVTKEVK